MPQDAKYGSGQHLVETEADESAEPSPKQKVKFLKNEERDEHGAK